MKPGTVLAVLMLIMPAIAGAGQPPMGKTTAANGKVRTEKKQAVGRGRSELDARAMETLRRISAPPTSLRPGGKGEGKPLLRTHVRPHSPRQKAPRARLLGKETNFQEAPWVPSSGPPSILERTTGLSGHPDGIGGDTLWLGGTGTLPFSFAPGYISAILTVYYDADNDGLLGGKDLLVSSRILLMDNDENDADLATGKYALPLGLSGLGLSNIAGRFILSVDNFQTITNTVVTVAQRPLPSVLRIQTNPPVALYEIELSQPAGWDIFFTDSTGKADVFVDPGSSPSATVYAGDPFGQAAGYIPPPDRQVSLGGDTTSIVLTLTKAGSFVRGFCLDDAGKPVPGVRIDGFGGAGYEVWAVSDSTGRFSIGVERGMWDISAERASGSYMSANGYRYVTLDTNSTAIVNFTFWRAASNISGAVRYAGAGVGGVTVGVYTDSLSNRVLTQADGRYTLPVSTTRPGYSPLDVYPSLPNHTYYIEGPGDTIVNPGAVGVDFTLSMATGGARGTVTNSITGKPVVGADVDFEGTSYAWCMTDSSGAYRTPLRDGMYQVYASAPAYSSPVLSPVTISGTFVTLNISMIPEGVITGKIRAENGKSVPNAAVTAYDSALYTNAYAYPDTAGIYFLNGLIPGRYILRVSAQGYLTQYYNLTTDPAKATPVVVKAGDTTHAIDFALPLGGTISGVVVNRSGLPIPGAYVSVADSMFYWSSSAVTDDSGRYAATGLLTGDYEVEASASGYAVMWYKDAQSYLSAAKVHVIEHHETKDINFTLPRGSSITGYVRDELKRPLGNAWVYIVDSLSAGYAGSYTDSSGRYGITGLAPGGYRATAYANLREPQWFDHKASLESADPIRLAPEEIRSGIDFDLSHHGIFGSVVDDSSGMGIPNAKITATADDINYYTVLTDYSGSFNLSPPWGSYAVRIECDDGTHGCRRYYTSHGTAMFEKDAEKVVLSSGSPGKEVDFRVRSVRSAASCTASNLAVTLTNRGVFTNGADTTGPSGRWPSPRGKNYLFEADQWVGGKYVTMPWVYGTMYNGMGGSWHPATDFLEENTDHQTVRSYIYCTDFFAYGYGAGILARQEAESWPKADFVICRRTVFYDANMSPSMDDFSDVYVGLFADFDVSVNGQKDLAGIDTANHLVYVFDATGKDSAYLGLCVLDATPVHLSWWSANYDTSYRTQEERYSLLSSGVRESVPAQGRDCRVMASTGPFVLGRGDSIRVSMAIVAGRGVSGVIQAAQKAKAQNLVDGVKGTGAPVIPASYALQQNYPNPFNPSTNITFDVPKQSRVVLKVFNVVGQEVSTLVDEVRPAGQYSVRWSGASAASGVYFYMLNAGSFVQTRKMILVK